jgi:hypothetical protein
LGEGADERPETDQDILLPVIEVLAVFFRMPYFKPKSVILAGRGQRISNLRLTVWFRAKEFR